MIYVIIKSDIVHAVPETMVSVEYLCLQFFLNVSSVNIVDPVTLIYNGYFSKFKCIIKYTRGTDW